MRSLSALKYTFPGLKYSGLFSLSRRYILKISLIVAVGKDGVIGSQGDIPWKCSEDLKHFKRLTSIPNSAVLMGRKTYDSLPASKLPGRLKAILTREKEFTLTPVDTSFYATHPVDVLVDLESKGIENVFIIGGGEIYKQYLPLVNDKVHLSLIKDETKGDTYFPINTLLESGFVLTNITWISPDCTALTLNKGN